TRLPVGEIGFGAWAIGGNHVGNSYGPTDDAESRRAVRRAFELGCTFFDTADVYGHGKSEELLGAALRDVRDRVILATKVGGNFYNRDVHPLLAERIAQMVDTPFDQIPPEEGVAAVSATMPDAVQIVYNRARREAEDEFSPAARAAGIGVIAREPLANGFLAGKYAWDSTWEKGDIRARMPRPYVKQMAA